MLRLIAIATMFCLFLLGLPNLTNAQDQQPPKKSTSNTQENGFGSFFGESMQTQIVEMTTHLIDGYLDYLAKPQTAKKLATIHKNYYDALVEQGFSKDQAFQLVLRFGNPLVDSPRVGK